MIPFTFGAFPLDPKQIFLCSRLAVGFVNLRPICAGHVLVSTRRRVEKYQDLDSQEREALWESVSRVHEMLESVYGHQVQIAIQNGRQSGQSVPHVHVHCMPCSQEQLGQVMIEMAGRADRSMAEMEQESVSYRTLL